MKIGNRDVVRSLVAGVSALRSINETVACEPVKDMIAELLKSIDALALHGCDDNAAYNEKVSALDLALEAFPKFGVNRFTVVATLDINKPETIHNFSKFGDALLDAYLKGYAQAKADA